MTNKKSAKMIVGQVTEIRRNFAGIDELGKTGRAVKPLLAKTAKSFFTERRKAIVAYSRIVESDHSDRLRGFRCFWEACFFDLKNDLQQPISTKSKEWVKIKKIESNVRSFFENSTESKRCARKPLSKKRNATPPHPASKRRAFEKTRASKKIILRKSSKKQMSPLVRLFASQAAIMVSFDRKTSPSRDRDFADLVVKNVERCRAMTKATMENNFCNEHPNSMIGILIFMHRTYEWLIDLKGRGGESDNAIQMSAAALEADIERHGPFIRSLIKKHAASTPSNQNSIAQQIANIPVGLGFKEFIAFLKDEFCTSAQKVLILAANGTLKSHGDFSDDGSGDGAFRTIRADGFLSSKYFAIDKAAKDGQELHKISACAYEMERASPALIKAFDDLTNLPDFSVEKLIDFIGESPFFGANNKNQIERGIRAWREQKNLESIVTLIPQIENAMRRMILVSGLKTKKGSFNKGYNSQTMGELLHADSFGEFFDDKGFGLHFRSLYTDSIGWSLRNKVAHGFFENGTISRESSCWVLHSIIWIASFQIKTTVKMARHAKVLGF